MAEEERVPIVTEGEREIEQPAEVEQQARDAGWLPKEEYRGREERWKPASEYLDMTEHVMPLIKKERDTLKRELNAEREARLRLDAEVKDQRILLKTLEDESTGNTLAQAEGRLTTARAELRQAITNNDVEAQAALTEEVATLNLELKGMKAEAEKEPEERKEAPRRPVVSPENERAFNEWIVQNAWYKNPKFAAAASVTAAEIVTESLDAGDQPPGGRALLDEVTKRMDKEFNVSRRPAGDKVLQPRGGVVHGVNGSRYSELPADAKAECDKQAKRFVGEGKRHKDLASWRTKYATTYFEATK